MPDPSPPPQHPNPRALAIMDAARKCFEHHGFHAASMANIAAKAGISVGHIYRYFDNKDAVVTAIVAQDLEGISRDLISLTGEPAEMAGQILEQVQDDRPGRRLILWLEVRAEGARNPKIAAMIQQAEDSIRGDLRRAIVASWRLAGLSAASAEDLVDIRISLVGLLVEGLQMRALHEGGPASPALVAHVGALLTRVLTPTPILADQVEALRLPANIREARKPPSSSCEPPPQSRR